MLKFMPVFANRPDISREQCRRHYRENHARLCASVESFNRHMCKYVQNWAIEGTSPREIRTVGAAECWFYSVDGFHQAFAEPSYAQFREDEMRFGDMDDLILVGAQPSHIFGPTAGIPLKVMRFAKIRKDVDRATAHRFWETDYARELAADAGVRAVLRSYVQNRQIPGFATNFPPSSQCDIAEEFWLAHRDAWPEAIAAEADLRRRTGYDTLFDVEMRIEFLADSKTVWDLGERPASALAMLGSPGELDRNRELVA